MILKSDGDQIVMVGVKKDGDHLLAGLIYAESQIDRRSVKVYTPDKTVSYEIELPDEFFENSTFVTGVNVRIKLKTN